MSNNGVRYFIETFEVILFDMGDTFMFDCDRFSIREDYQAVYHALGGTRFNQKALFEAMNHIYVSLLEMGREVRRYDTFPSVSEFMDSDDYFKDVEVNDKRILLKIFGMYECGAIPDSSGSVLSLLSSSHRLGLISNVWSESQVFRKKLREAGVDHLFSKLIFSSDHGAYKPSPRLFALAAEYFGLPYHQMVYVGNSYRRDVLGAKSVGMKAILVDNGPESRITGEVTPDFVIPGIEALVS